MLPQGQFPAVGTFPALAVGDRAALAGAGPVGQTRLGVVGHAVGGALALGGVAIDVVLAGIQRAFAVLGAAVLETQLGPVRDHGLGRRVGRVGLGLLALQQGIALDLGLDEGVELLVRQLQQLDRLLHLGRDDQPLALPYLKPLTDHFG